MAEAGGAPAVLRLCLDLNIWVGDQLGRSREPGTRMSAGNVLTRDSEIPLADRVCIDRSPNWETVIAVPQEAAGWLRQGIFPDAAAIRRAMRRPRGGRSR